VTLVAVGRQAKDGAQRSSLGRARDANLARQVRALDADPFMRTEIARPHARRKVAQRVAAERAAAPAPAGRRESGTGWPGELTRQPPGEFRVY